jgi:hypothetical protein
VRIVSNDAGVQVLFRKLPFGLTVGYIPKANLDPSLLPEIDSVCKESRAVFLKVEPHAWADSLLHEGEGLRAKQVA